MKLILLSDGRGIDIQFQLTWRVAKALALALAALAAMPEVARLVTLLGW